MRRAAKIDSNQNKVVGMLRKIPGVSVAITSQLGNGFVDIVVGYKGINYMIELKDGDKVASKRKLTVDEIEFSDKWKGQYNVCKDFDEVFNLINGKTQTAKRA